jgi:alkylation response protein AidB-like acyl-CoA dehydrogenase
VDLRIPHPAESTASLIRKLVGLPDDQSLPATLHPSELAGDPLRSVRAEVRDLWSRPPVPGDGRLTQAVLLCEDAGMALVTRSIATDFLLAWLARGADPQLAAAFESEHCSISPWRSPGVVARRDHGGFRLDGKATVSGRSRWPSHAVVSIDHGGSTRYYLVDLASPGSARVRLVTLDPSESAEELELADAVAYPIEVSSTEDGSDAVEALARVLLSAEALGLARRLLWAAVAYSKVRRQFGVSISSFQAVSHGLAEAYSELELARSLLYGVAAQHLGDGRPPSDRAAMVKALAGDVAPAIADRAIQVFGAEGMTTSRGVHLVLRRILTLAASWGGVTECTTEVVACLDRSVREAAGKQGARC